MKANDTQYDGGWGGTKCGLKHLLTHQMERMVELKGV